MDSPTFDRNDPRNFHYLVNGQETDGKNLSMDEIVETITVQLYEMRPTAENAFNEITNSDDTEVSEAIELLKTVLLEQIPGSKFPFVTSAICDLVSASTDYDQLLQTNIDELYVDFSKILTSEIAFLTLFFGNFGEHLEILIWVLTWNHIRRLAENWEN